MNIGDEKLKDRKKSEWENFNIQKHWKQVRLTMDKAFNQLKAMGIKQANYLSLPSRTRFTTETGRPYTPRMSLEVLGIDFPWKNDAIAIKGVDINKQIIEFSLNMSGIYLTADISFSNVLKLDIPNTVRQLIAEEICKAVDERLKYYKDKSHEFQQWKRMEPIVQQALNTSAKIFKYIADNS